MGQGPRASRICTALVNERRTVLCANPQACCRTSLPLPLTPSDPPSPPDHCPTSPQAEVSSLRKELGTEMVSALTQEEQAEMTWVAGVGGGGLRA